MEYLQHNLIWIAAALVSGGMLLYSYFRDAGISISIQDATLLVNREDAVLLDVRETREWDDGHLPNARHIALGQLETRLSELDKLKARNFIVYCASGNRSASACGKLKKLGFEKVHNLAGGIRAWTEAGLPITTKR